MSCKSMIFFFSRSITICRTCLHKIYEAMSNGLCESLPLEVILHLVSTFSICSMSAPIYSMLMNSLPLTSLTQKNPQSLMSVLFSSEITSRQNQLSYKKINLITLSASALQWCILDQEGEVHLPMHHREIFKKTKKHCQCGDD